MERDAREEARNVIPEGTRYYLPPEAQARLQLTARWRELFAAWGYAPVELPALEIFDPAHPLAERAFKLVDKSGRVLALRSEFTTALVRMAQTQDLGPAPQRLQYAGRLWLRDSEVGLGRMREFAQVGVEVFGASSPRIDAELIALAAEALAAAGLAGARIEVGLPAFVADLLDATGLEPEPVRRLHAAIDRKNTPELAERLERYGVRGALAEALLALPDLFGGREVLAAARRHAVSERARIDLDWLEEVLALLPAGVEPLFDLGMARAYDYYSGIHFRAYTPDFGLPLLGGGRYDGAGVPFAAGFALGLERVLEAAGRPAAAPVPDALALDAATARALRAQGLVVELAWTDDLDELRAYAHARGIPRIAGPEGEVRP
ncbi:ATP phosphoribosyltransferase regulatory subunit [Oceanithermus profundus DSM 14977]|uniref:ATP phosphoribosyltransferase regulatory subunit n=1 Tax=Oceanithermus profundus (strain DSM 14977 / NBRC 100410 / VKM B-2274 / 506) TaxID=670487 RepID=E4U613_OCEP5|nr:ATP phosphoribosyltransferase regulatory subunit [Oceanithermus profundus DSM 14977]